MQTILEIFYLRIIGTRVRYERKKVNLSRKGSDPDKLIWSHIRQKRSDDAEEEQEFVVHSTSWRYERPGKILLTYIAYPDDLTFKTGKSKSLALKHLQSVSKKSRKPRSAAELEKKLVARAMRHIAFLIKTDNQIDFESAMTPKLLRLLRNFG